MNRANAEVILISRCGTALDAASLDGTTINGSNAALNDPLWYALDRLGYSVASISAVVDADIQAITSDDYAPFLDIAELRTLETVLNAATGLVDFSVGPRKESLSQFAERLEKTIQAKRQRVLQEYGDLFGSGFEGGTFSIASQEDGENLY
jgi:hypothetical protein